ncbi:MAG: cell division topological specificity factor MinE [Chloroflexi bacterium]|nr:cell division topological specificity factor MinE [Chloroflexota bacterium]
MKLLNKLFGKDERRVASKELAKERLRVVLIHDRTDVSPELLETLRQEIIAVISEHVIIDETEGIEVTISQTRGRSRLQANIPLLGMRRRARPATRAPSRSGAATS